jgi:hypothetical protein
VLLDLTAIQVDGMLNIFSGENAALMASVVAFTAFFLIGRLAQARQGVAFAFAFTPLLAFCAIATMAALL